MSSAWCCGPTHASADKDPLAIAKRSKSGKYSSKAAAHIEGVADWGVHFDARSLCQLPHGGISAGHCRVRLIDAGGAMPAKIPGAGASSQRPPALRIRFGVELEAQVRYPPVLQVRWAERVAEGRLHTGTCSASLHQHAAGRGGGTHLEQAGQDLLRRALHH